MDTNDSPLNDAWRKQFYSSGRVTDATQHGQGRAPYYHQAATDLARQLKPLLSDIDDLRVLHKGLELLHGPSTAVGVYQATDRVASGIDRVAGAIQALDRAHIVDTEAVTDLLDDRNREINRLRNFQGELVAAVKELLDDQARRYHRSGKVVPPMHYRASALLAAVQSANEPF